MRHARAELAEVAATWCDASAWQVDSLMLANLYVKFKEEERPALGDLLSRKTLVLAPSSLAPCSGAGWSQPAGASMQSLAPRPRSWKCIRHLHACVSFTFLQPTLLFSESHHPFHRVAVWWREEWPSLEHSRTRTAGLALF